MATGRMRIIGTVVLVLAGILNFANAAELDIKASCSNYGDPAALVSAQKSMVDLATHINSKQVDFREALQRNSTQSEPAFEEICNNTVEDQTIADLTKNVVESGKLCLAGNEHETFNNSFKVLASVKKFACDNIELLKKAATSPRIQCVVSKYGEFENCSDIHKAQVSNANAYNLMTLSGNMTDVLSVLKIGLTLATEECSNILKSQRCAIDVVKQCEDEVFEDVLYSLYTYINIHKACGNLTESETPELPKSGASPTSVFSFMILTISLMSVSV